MGAIDLKLDPATPEGAPTLVSEMSADQILAKAETDRLAASVMLEEMENEQRLTLGKLIDRTAAATERIERAADAIEIMLEVTQQQTAQVKEQAEEIKEILEPTPATPAEPTPAPAAKKKSGISRFLI